MFIRARLVDELFFGGIEIKLLPTEPVADIREMTQAGGYVSLLNIAV